MKEKVLVTGGLGFIGSHTVVALYESGFEPIIVDNLSNSEESILDGITDIIGEKPVCYIGDIRDKELLTSIFLTHDIKSVIHFAAHKAVGESVKEPLKYYDNNINGLISLLDSMSQFFIKNIVFSSSCTVYGEPDEVPVNEESKIKRAESPYGATKQMGERILEDNSSWFNIQCLRYFNPIGAHPSGKIGELPIGVPNNLIPYLTQTAIGLRDCLTVFGGDYNTNDGTCIRDYIHVMDLAEAHVSSVKRLSNKTNTSKFEVFNIGTGVGYSVLEVINTFEEVTGIKVNYTIGERRDGDITEVWADNQKVRETLNWSSNRDLYLMLRDSWNWQKQISLK